MKIYYVANASIPNKKAHGIQIAKTCESFVVAGVDLTLLAPRRRRGKESLASYYGLREEIPTTYLPTIDLYLFGRIGFAVSSFFFACSYTICLWSKVLQGEKFLIYSVDMDTFSSLPLLLFPRPFFSELHGARRINFLTKLYFKYITGIVAINSYVKKRVVEKFFVNENKVLAEHNGVDLSVFKNDVSITDARKRLGIKEGGPVTLYVGRFYSWKGLHILAELAKLLPTVSVYVVGGTHDEFVTLTDVTELPENLIFCGSKSSKEIPLWLAAANSLLLLGTLKDPNSVQYTSPMKAFEYMASGRPVVASSTPAVTNIFDAENAYFYTPDDVSSLAEAVISAHGDMNQSILNNAHTKAEFHSWGKRAERILGFVQETIGS